MLTYTQPINKNHHYTVSHYQCGVCCLRDRQTDRDREEEKKRDRIWERDDLMKGRPNKTQRLRIQQCDKMHWWEFVSYRKYSTGSGVKTDAGGWKDYGYISTLIFHQQLQGRCQTTLWIFGNTREGNKAGLGMKNKKDTIIKGKDTFNAYTCMQSIYNMYIVVPAIIWRCKGIWCFKFPEYILWFGAQAHIRGVCVCVCVCVCASTCS